MHFTHKPCGRASVAVATMLAAVAVAGPLQAREKIMQLSEDGAVTRTIAADKAQSLLLAGASTRVCEKNAQWIRLGFKSLVLKSYDSLVLTSSGGDRYVFQGGHWNDRSFSARALRGSCVDIQPYFASKGSSYQVGSYDFGKMPLSTSRKVTGAAAATVASVVVAGAGDICDSDSSATCKATSDLIVAMNPTAVFTAGDNVYENGALSEYNARYAPTWGRFKDLTKPTPGNHEYQTSGASGYFDYFGTTLTGTGADRSKGYYSWDVGDWHFVALNTMSGGTVATAQINWLKADLAASTKPCTAAYFHHPLESRGNYAGYAQVKPFWDALYAAKADLVLNGHDHNYQRYAKMNASKVAAADGIRQVLVGTGGRQFYGVSAPSGLMEVSNDNTYGVLKLTLTATGYTGEFVPETGGTFTDTFTGTCNAKPGGTPNVAPVANFTSSVSGATANFTDTSTDSDGTIASRAWTFGDGTTSTVTNPSKTYAASGTYPVTLTVTDNAGATNTKSGSVTVTVPPTSTVLTNGVPVTGITLASKATKTWTLVVPAGATNLKFVTSGGSGDADLFAKFGSAPTETVNDCKSTGNTSAETCTIATAQAGTYYVMVLGYNAISGVSLTGSYTVPSGNVAPVANFTSTTSGLTAAFTDTSTDSDGTIASRVWDFGDGTTSTVANPSKTYAVANTYNVKLTVTDNSGATNSKTVAVTVGSTSCGGNVLCSGTAVALPAGAAGTFSSAYTLVVPAGKTSVTFALSGGTGDADMYVNLGSALTTTVSAAVNTATRCVPWKTGNIETCTFSAPTAGTYYVTVHAYQAYTGVSLKGTVAP